MNYYLEKPSRLQRLKARVDELEEEIAQLRSRTDAARRSLHKALESPNPAHAFTMIEEAISAVSVGEGDANA